MSLLSFRKFVIYTAGILGGLLVLVGLLAWLLGTEPALQWCVQQAQRLSNGRLTLHAVHGSLYGPLHIGALSFQAGEKRYEVKQAQLDWAPGALLKLHIDITRLSLQELSITDIKPAGENQPAAEPATLPATLHLPLTLSAPAITLERIVFKQGDTQHVLGNIDLGVEKSADSYQLNLRSIESEWGKGEADMVLGDTRPYNLSAHATLQQRDAWVYRAEADASGSLAQLLLNAKVHTPDGQAEIKATLTPFEQLPLAAAHLSAYGINPARIRKGLPQAALSADISVARKGADGLQGSISVRNKLPGALDQSRLPVREMALQFAGNMEQLELRAIQLDLAAAGNFKGAGQIKSKRLQLNLNTTDFNPRGVHSKMRRMRLAGNIAIQADRKNQQLSADLRYRQYKVNLKARRQDAVVELRNATIQSGSGSSTGSLTLHGTLELEGRKPFQLQGKLQKFNPAEFGDYPAAAINASFSAGGQLAAEPRATLKLASLTATSCSSR
jgi:translocation and assembly module TamB